MSDWDAAAVEWCKAHSPFWPVGEMTGVNHLVAELRVAGDRMLIQSGVMKDWSERFYALAASMEAASRTQQEERKC